MKAAVNILSSAKMETSGMCYHMIQKNALGVKHKEDCFFLEYQKCSTRKTGVVHLCKWFHYSPKQVQEVRELSCSFGFLHGHLPCLCLWSKAPRVIGRIVQAKKPQQCPLKITDSITSIKNNAPYIFYLSLVSR